MLETKQLLPGRSVYYAWQEPENTRKLYWTTAEHSQQTNLLRQVRWCQHPLLWHILEMCGSLNLEPIFLPRLQFCVHICVHVHKTTSLATRNRIRSHIPCLPVKLQPYVYINVKTSCARPQGGSQGRGFAAWLARPRRSLRHDTRLRHDDTRLCRARLCRDTFAATCGATRIVCRGHTPSRVPTYHD